MVHQNQPCRLTFGFDINKSCIIPEAVWLFGVTHLTGQDELNSQDSEVTYVCIVMKTCRHTMTVFCLDLGQGPALAMYILSYLHLRMYRKQRQPSSG